MASNTNKQRAALEASKGDIFCLEEVDDDVMGVVRQYLGDRGFDFVFKRRTRAKRDGTLIAWSRLRWRPAALPGARGVITSGQAHVASVEYNDIASDIEAAGVELSPREYMTDSVGVMVRHIHSPRGVKRGTLCM